MIVAPRWDGTRAIMGSKWSMIVPSLVFVWFFVVASLIDASSPAELAEKVRFLFIDAIQDPAKMAQMSASSPAYAAQDWIHLIVWDLLAGRWVYLDGLEKNVSTRLSLWAIFSAGPIGLLLHLAICAVADWRQKSAT